MQLSESQQLISRIIKTESIRWKYLQFIQQDTFKEWVESGDEKLFRSLLKYQFVDPFKVWEKDGKLFCLDGKHRWKDLNKAIELGIDIPELLPATFIDCRDEKEAAELVLIYSSRYAQITQQGLFDFIQQYELNYGDIKQHMDIPDFSTDRFEQKFDLFQVGEAEEPEAETDGELIVKIGDIFDINGHRIICGSFLEPLVQSSLMDGRKARILICDPPYNLPANFFTNKDEKRHKNFAMGAGEMTDEEFVLFLESIMRAGLLHTIEGSIHYIFMDWRHVWHMTEAGRRVYGSVVPKQLCVWNKDMMANGSFYRAKHELCFAFSTPQSKALWNKDLLDHGGFYKDENELVFIFKAGDEDVKHLSHLELADRIRTNVWDYPSATSIANPDRYELKNHPTPKPVRMIADAILDTTNEKDIVIDWFLGSGTCLIACEQTGRYCYGSDIEPRYIQSIIKRYLSFCDKKGIEVNFAHLNGNLTINEFTNEQSITN